VSVFTNLCLTIKTGARPVDGSAGVFIKSATTVLSRAWTMLGATVSSAQSQYVYSGGLATACVISSGGFQEVRSGGVASDCQYFAHFAVRNGGLISGGTAVHNNGSIGSVYVGGVLTDITIGGISSWNAVYVHGVISNTTFLTAGELWLRSGGTAMDITVGSSGGAYAWTYGGLIMTADGAYISGVTFSGGYMSAVGSRTLVEDLKIVYPKLAPSFYSSAVCSGAVLYPTNAYMGLNTGASAYDVVISGGTLALNASDTYASNVQAVGSGARIMGTGTFENVLLSNTLASGITYAYIQPLGRAHSMRIFGSAACSIYSGATGTDIYLEGGPTAGVSRPSVVVSNGGYVSGVSTGQNAVLYLRGNTDNVYIESNTSGYVSSGVVLNGLVMSGGTVWAYTGATLSGASICSGAINSNILSLSGCSADRITAGMRGYITLRAGTTATNIDLQDSAWIYVSSGTATNITASAGCSVYASRGGVLSGVTGVNVARIAIASGGIGYDVHMLSGGVIAMDPTASVYGLYLSDTQNVTFNSNVYIENLQQLSVSQGQVTNRGSMVSAVINRYYYNSGYCSGLTISGTSGFTVVYATGSGYLEDADLWRPCTVSGSASNVRLYSTYIHIMSGGKADSVTVSGGTGLVSSGGTLTAATIMSGGSLVVESGGTAINVSNLSGTVNCTGAYLSDAYTEGFGYVHLYSTTICSGISIGAGGRLNVYSGSIVSDVYGGQNAALKISSGGTAYNVSCATDVLSSGYLSGANVNNLFIYMVSNGGVIEDVDIPYGRLRVHGTAVNIRFNRTELTVYSGGVLSGVSVTTNISAGGTMFVSSGGLAKDVVVTNYGVVSGYTSGRISNCILSGASVTGWMGWWDDVQVLGGKLYVRQHLHNALFSSGNGCYIAGDISGIRLVAGNLFVETSNTDAYDLHIEKGYLQGQTSARLHDVIVSGGTLRINSTASASGVTVSSGGSLIVSSGGTALAVTSNAGAVVNVLEGGYIEYL